MIRSFTTGDALAIPVTLKIDNTPQPIDSSATIIAGFVDKDNQTQISPTVSVLESATGSDWANGKIIVEMTSAETIQIALQEDTLAKLKIRVDDTVNMTGQKTWRDVVMLEKGIVT